MSEKPAAPRESWEGLRRQSTSTSDTNDELATMVMTATTSAAGRLLMEWLRAETIEKRSQRGAPEAHLRELEAQRSLVFRIEELRDKGLEIAVRKAKATT